MLSIHFNKQVFINSLKANKKIVIYLSTSIALMVMLMIHGLIQGNLKPEFFIYALFVSVAFYVWDVIDHKFRKQRTEFLD
ncbi:MULTISPECIES: hypothetical protein [Acinetobacter]|uniref:Uncharacterized protein n=1 Tax=Acinetobacter silvestris TaxID=1977882 RepID=A0A1Y3CH16_9GAMM|nr:MULTISPECIES: hypothetical protein [Acinetobacter]OTG65191.1 hypothetical protein B9T28_10430 [Acinetobacter silvestris]OTG82975.1 hypothetical protein B9T27_06815 [Acinetobacter sp. ANC 4648]